MVDRPALSKGEMEIARVLWEIGPASVREIHSELLRQRNIDFATVQTYLRRIEAKGYASSKLEGRIKIYSAKAKPRTVIRDTVDDLVDRLFGGETMPLVRHLIEERGIEEGELNELKGLIDQLEASKEKATKSAKSEKGKSSASDMEEDA
ncbi:MAG: BlaI/MecI/CopY family transcriptional regulator [Planctomycetota bacterium]